MDSPHFLRVLFLLYSFKDAAAIGNCEEGWNHLRDKRICISHFHQQLMPSELEAACAEQRAQLWQPKTRGEIAKMMELYHHSHMKKLLLPYYVYRNESVGVTGVSGEPAPPNCVLCAGIEVDWSLYSPTTNRLCLISYNNQIDITIRADECSPGSYLCAKQDISLLERAILTHYDLAAICVASAILISLTVAMCVDLKSTEVENTRVDVKDKLPRVEPVKGRVDSVESMKTKEERS